MILRRLTPEQVPARRGGAVDDEALKAAQVIIDDVRSRGETALRDHAHRLGDLARRDDAIIVRCEGLHAALAALSVEQRGVLERTAERIAAFARAQLACVSELSFPIAGGEAGHRVQPVDSAGCYAPGGRFPLPSSALMTAVTARVAGVPTVWVASPRPAPVTLAAAAVAGAAGVLAAGGAQAIGAIAYGAGDVPPCEVIVGPGNRWVTAAKFLVSKDVRIDMLAGPSELVVVADDSAHSGMVAADLLAQAEHDVDALPVLIAVGPGVVDAVEHELARQLADLPTAATARAALRQGYAVEASSNAEAAVLANAIAPEHLQLSVREPESVARDVHRYGSLFIGERSAEVLGDYGAGPNHVLPTGGTARATAGLSVLHFLRFATHLHLRNSAGAEGMVRDAIALARMEGLEAHARAAERRLGA